MKEKPTAEVNEMLTDTEVCKLFRISKPTLRRHLQDGPPRQRHPSANDIRLINHVKIGGKRRWSKASVMSFIGGV